MSTDAQHGTAADDADEPRRRFRRRNDRIEDGAGEALAAVHAEILLLREENARLKAAQHQRVDISRLIGRARSLSSAEIDRDSVGDDTEQLLVEGLLIRESLVEICQEIERSMVAFEAKLNALAAVTAGRSRPQEARSGRWNGKTNGHGVA
ncbi:MAG TPA: hypothetical protein VK501_04050 [Baekduia sp.]|uniref:hypothetical protein n=1 Tax=Baekduia sp. TaxID=2600305 RepID=UPI002D0075E6|nr:hypothetical protein [Baekduia sp.]HMJ33069.1 hypothetical protein [Baekduia sp.]